MFSLFDHAAGPHAATRRELLRVGGLSLLGLGSQQLASWRAAASERNAPRAKSCIFIFLFGGPATSICGI